MRLIFKYTIRIYGYVGGIEGSPIRETLELDSFVALIGATMKLFYEFAGTDRKVARAMLMLALNDAINDHFAEMNGGM